MTHPNGVLCYRISAGGRSVVFATDVEHGDKLDKRLLDSEPVSGRGRQVSSPSREAEVLGRWLDVFSTSSGGALIRVQGLTNDPGPARLARETASHYVLAVEASPADRAGSVQRLRVRVDARGALVRARQAVAAR
jgi:hypothetical protein